MSKLIGRVLLNQFRVDAFIEAGGMGVVYKVWDLKRNVTLAMKVLQVDPNEDTVLFGKFKREANALKYLSHPNIVPFYGLYQQDRYAFLLEKFIDGPTLKDVLQDSEGVPQPLPTTLTVMKSLCSALGYAHAHGIIHCDVKPGNVMIELGGAIFLTDFGIARHADSTTTTLAGAGTPGYMAPEQFLEQSVFPATDVYALGVILFEMLSGQRLFRGTEPGAERGGETSRERIRYAHLHLLPPDLCQLNPSIPASLAAVVHRALSKDPRARYQSTQEFFAAFLQSLNVSLEAIPDRLMLPSKYAQAPAIDLTRSYLQDDSAVYQSKPVSSSAPAAPPPRSPTASGQAPSSSRPVSNPPAQKPASGSSQPARVRTRSGPFWTIFGIGLVVLVVAGLVIQYGLYSSTNSPKAVNTIAAPALKPPADTGPVTIANLAPLSGPVPSFGLSSRSGFLLAIKEWNAKGGVLGRQIEPVVVDSGCTAAPAIEASRKVISQNGARFIIGEVCSGASIPVSEIAEQSGVLMISPTSTSARVTLNSDGSVKQYTFRTCFIDPFQGTVMAKFAGERGYTTAFIVYDPGNDYVSGLAAAFEKAWKELGYSVVGKETYSSQDTDFSAILEKVIQADADVIYIPDYDNVVNQFASQARQMGVSAVLLGGDSWDSASLDKAALAGSYYTNHYSPEDPRPAVQEWVQRYAAEFGQVPDAIATLTYDLTNILLAAIERAGVADPAVVKEILASSTFDAVTGQISFDRNHNPIKSAAILAVEPDRIVFVESVAP